VQRIAVQAAEFSCISMGGQKRSPGNRRGVLLCRRFRPLASPASQDGHRSAGKQGLSAFPLDFLPARATIVVMPRPSRFLFLSLAAVVVGLAVGLWLLWPRTAITRANAAKIQVGMTMEQVEAIFGGTQRMETTGRFEIDPDEEEIKRGHLDPAAPFGQWQWLSAEVQVRVWSDDLSRVTAIQSIPVRRAPESLLDKLHRWLRL
jgi:hypothetical protein